MGEEEAKNPEDDDSYVLAAQRVRDICRKLMNNAKIQSPKKSLFSNLELPKKVQLRPSMIDRACLKSKVVSSTPMTASKKLKFIPDSSGSVSPIDEPASGSRIDKPTSSTEEKKIQPVVNVKRLDLSNTHDKSVITISSSSALVDNQSQFLNDLTANKSIKVSGASKLDSVVQKLLTKSLQEQAEDRNKHEVSSPKKLNTSNKTVQTSKGSIDKGVLKKRSRCAFFSINERAAQTGPSLDGNSVRNLNGSSSPSSNISYPSDIIKEAKKITTTQKKTANVSSRKEPINNKKIQTERDNVPWRAPSGLYETMMPTCNTPVNSVLEDSDESFRPKLPKKKKVFTNKKKQSTYKTNNNENKKIHEMPTDSSTKSTTKRKKSDKKSSTAMDKAETSRSSNKSVNKDQHMNISRIHQNQDILESVPIIETDQVYNTTFRSSPKKRQHVQNKSQRQTVDDGTSHEKNMTEEDLTNVQKTSKAQNKPNKKGKGDGSPEKQKTPKNKKNDRTIEKEVVESDKTVTKNLRRKSVNIIPSDNNLPEDAEGSSQTGFPFDWNNGRDVNEQSPSSSISSISELLNATDKKLLITHRPPVDPNPRVDDTILWHPLTGRCRRIISVPEASVPIRTDTDIDSEDDVAEEDINNAQETLTVQKKNNKKGVSAKATTNQAESRKSPKVAKGKNVNKKDATRGASSKTSLAQSSMNKGINKSHHTNNSMVDENCLEPDILESVPDVEEDQDHHRRTRSSPKKKQDVQTKTQKQTVDDEDVNNVQDTLKGKKKSNRKVKGDVSQATQKTTKNKKPDRAVENEVTKSNQKVTRGSRRKNASEDNLGVNCLVEDVPDFVAPQAKSCKKNIPEKSSTRKKSKAQTAVRLTFENSSIPEPSISRCTPEAVSVSNESGVRRSTRERRPPAPKCRAGYVVCKSDYDFKRYDCTQGVNSILSSTSNTRRNSKSRSSVKKRNNKISTISTCSPIQEVRNEIDFESAVVEPPAFTDSPKENLGSTNQKQNRVISGRIDRRNSSKNTRQKILNSLQKTVDENQSLCNYLNICDNNVIRTMKWSVKNPQFKKCMPGVSTAVVDGYATGFIKIDGGKAKPKQTTSRQFNFVVLEGRAEVGVQEHICVHNEHDCFMVPAGGEYYIKNLNDQEELLLTFTKFPVPTRVD